MKIWKNVLVDREEKHKYSEIYEVSNEGEIRNKKTKRILKLKICKDGYLRIGLHHKGRCSSYSIHRLVLLAFNYEGYFPKAEVNHKDEDKTNNCLENLEWCTAKYNSNYGNRTLKATKHLYDENGNFKGIKRDKKSNICTNNKEVVDIRNNKHYKSIKECAKDIGVGYKTLQYHLNNRRKVNKYFYIKYL